MKLLDIQAAIGTAILLLSSPCVAKHQHSPNLEVLGRRHNHRRLHATTSRMEEGIEVEGAELKKRDSCLFPTNAGLVAVTPGSSNAGWAMSPDQPCTPGTYCPYACPPGQVSMQWSPDATAYVYPESMAGGLYCDSNGAVSKPFPAKEYCVDGTGALGVTNNAAGVVSFCQTVLPGNEAMLIPTSVAAGATVTLAVPDTSYWCSTAAHYYVNPPGIGVSDACVWSDGTKPLGNWSPYVAGANTDSSGNTFAKLGWNPVWLASGLSTVMPTFGLKITCSGSGCNGLPCSITPTTDGIGGVTSSEAAAGAGGANFCVVTIPKGQTANIVVFDLAGSSSSAKAATSSTVAPSSTTSQAPTTSSTTSLSTSTTSSAAATTTSTSSKSSSTSATKSASYYTPIPLFVTVSATPTPSAHILFENQTSISSGTLLSGSATTSLGASGTSSIAAATTTKKSSATENFTPSSIFSLIVMLAVASYIL